MLRKMQILAQMGMAGTAHGILAGAFAALSLGALALTALYLVDHVQETPGIKTIRCYFWPGDADCPARHDAMAELQKELAELAIERDQIAREREAAKSQLEGLRAIENAVDRITLFETHGGPFDKNVVVGTVYRRLVEANPQPSYHYCYIELGNGPAGEQRNFRIRTETGDVSISDSERDDAGLSEQELARARGLCVPRLVGAGS